MRWPRLTELQIAVLACIRDEIVEPYVDYKLARFIGYPLFTWRAHGFDVTSQIRSLRKRKMIAFNGYFRNYPRLPHYGLTVQGQIELDTHPEF